jgi:hypothetical protein
MHPMAMRCAAVLLAGLAFGCNKPAPTPEHPSTASSPQTPETFNFAAQPVAFTPPPAGWEPEGELSRGIRGVRYVKRKSVGEAIGVGNYYDVSRRLRHAEIARLLTVNSDYESAAFDHAVREAWCYTDAPYTDLEAEVATNVNAALNRAVLARRHRDYETMRGELATAQQEADRLHFTFGDVVERAMFHPESASDPSLYHFVGRRDTSIAGQPAVVVDYTLELREGRRYLRKAYVMFNDHLFVAEFIGLQHSLAVFDNVVASISFPP